MTPATALPAETLSALEVPASARSARAAASALPARDRFIIGAMVFFVVMAYTIELYYVLFHGSVRTRSDFFARAYQVYGIADQAYYGGWYVYVAVALEALNVFVSQFLNLWLIYAIVKRRSYRYVLQIILSSYLAYSVVLYFTISIVSGFEGMPQRTPFAFFLLVAPNLPWLMIYAWMTWDAARVLLRQSAAAHAQQG